MRILIIRHGDPDYEHDTLTEKGKREAILLADRLEKEEIRDFYVSPLGRAKDTAAYTLERLQKTACEKNWLREFHAVVDLNQSRALQKAYPDAAKNESGYELRNCTWDLLPSYWREKEEYYGRDAWEKSEVTLLGNASEIYYEAAEGLDRLLAEYGYVREGHLYRTRKGNNDTICLFCHFGITCVLLSHLWGVSPFVLWHCLSTAPTSVTELYTEEREKSYAIFRASKVGDISHLYAGAEPPSFSTRFCECFENEYERH